MGNQRSNLPGHPVGRGHHYTVCCAQGDKSDVVRPNVPEVDCTMVTDRPAVHHSCSLRFSRPPSSAPNYLCHRGCCAPECLLVIIFFFTLIVCHRLGFGYRLSSTQSFTAISNNFELAIAVAVARFGLNSDQALVSTVGPLIEVPALLALVYIVRWMANRWQWKE